MKRTFTASVTREDLWYIAKALEVDVASQGESLEEALVNLREAIELYYKPSPEPEPPQLYKIEVDIAADGAAS